MNIGRTLMALSAIVAAGSAHAIVLITPGPGNFPNDENVLFNVDNLLDNGPVIEGITNTSNSIVVFDNSGEDLTTPSGGQARIEGSDGSLTDLTLSLEDSSLGFSTLIWNLHAAGDGEVTFTIARTGGPDIVETFDLDGSGQNFFRFEAMGEMFTSVTLSSTVALDDVRQVRVGVVPEPASLAVVGVGLVALMRRRRK